MSSFRTYFLVVIIGAVLVGVLICVAAAPMAELQRMDEQQHIIVER